ncbi:glycosyltransferase family 9 protein [Candidatus Woesearchaeota archaeon]|nr:glycosyltransferase family 9 protein [Candidatus Woesearchaeota archaeon]
MIALQRAIDQYVGSMLCFLLSPFKQRVVSKSPKKVLIVKLWAMGESILTLPFIHELKKTFPHATIDVLARKRNADVYTQSKDIDKVLFLEEASLVGYWKEYDLVFDCEPYLNLSALLAFFLGRRVVGFSHGVRSRLYTYTIPYNDRQHVVLTYLDMLRPFWKKVSAPKQLVPVAFSKADRQWVQHLIEKEHLGRKTLIAVCPGAAESAHSRMWSSEKFAKVLDTLIDSYDAAVLLVGGKDDDSIIREIMEKMEQPAYNLAGKTTLKQLAALLPHCRLMIANDTGPMHLAAAQGVPTIGLFCPNTPVRFAPYGKGNLSIYKPMFLKPCINVHKGEIPTCRTHRHMSQITVDDVIGAARKLFKKNTNA